MPSWCDCESGDSYSWLDGGSSDSDDPFVPFVEDPDYNGVDPECDVKCGCGFRMVRYVATEGTDAGRRFLGCGAMDETRCNKTHWVDPVHHLQMRRALIRLGWEATDLNQSMRTHMMNELGNTSFRMEEEKKRFEADLLADKKRFEEELIERCIELECRHQEEKYADKLHQRKMRNVMFGALAFVVAMFVVLLAFVLNKARS